MEEPQTLPGSVRQEVSEPGASAARGISANGGNPPSGPSRNLADALRFLPGANWSDFRWLAILLLVTVGLRAWQISNTAVTSRDSIGFMRIAWQMIDGNWLEAIRTAHQHPGYPTAIAAMFVPVRYFYSATLPEQMQLSCQLASALSSILLIFPVYYLGKELFDRRVGFWVCLLFQCMPVSSRLMADGLSEPFFFLCMMTGYYFAVRGLRTGSVASFSLAGFAIGLSYLTRPEGALAGLGAGIVLLAAQWVRPWRRPWNECIKCGVALTVSALILAGPFMYHIGGITLKLTGNKLLGLLLLKSEPEKDTNKQQTHRMPGSVSDRHLESLQSLTLLGIQGEQRRAGSVSDRSLSAKPLPPSPVLWAIWNFHPHTKPSERIWWSFWALAHSLVKGFFFFWWIFALLGAYLFRDRYRLIPGSWILVQINGQILILLYLVGVLMGYVSARHTLLVVLGGLYWGVPAAALMAGRVAEWCARRRSWISQVLGTQGWKWALGVLLLCSLLPLTRSLLPLHPQRIGFRHAGMWLEKHARPHDIIFDPYRWSRFYAGREFFAQQDLKWDEDRSVCYVVLDQSKSDHPYLLDVPNAKWVASHGKVIRRWLVPRKDYMAEVKIYLVHLPDSWRRD